MAERPLYTLYKNLKAQNYDVPDDYNKFESALTRDGKGGADNRHAIYENLKAQNFDVPNTYERFYSALFEPKSKTSSRAKGGSVPMSAADRARFSAGASAISASANNVVRQAKRNIQSKLGQAKKFNGGRVAPHLKNPLQNLNVQKNEFNYNSTTGKTGTYTTTDGVEFNNEYDAAQYQNQLDKQGEQYINAVDMGIVPSELDKADPDLSDTDVAMRQMERRQEWLNENQDRHSKELNESMHLQGSPFVASGGAVAPSSFNTAISNEANRLSDVEYGAYNTAKAYNQMLRTTLLQELKEQKQRNENAGWLKDKWNDVSNYFGAMFNTMLDPKLYSQGIMDAAISNNLLQVKKGMEDGTIKKGSNAGNAAQAMLGAIQQQQGEAAKQQQYGTKAYQYGDMSGRSLKFWGDFLLSGWRNVMTTGFTKAGEKVGEKMALGALGKWFTKNTGRVLGDMAGSAALAATNQLGSTYNNVIERYVGMNNENGGVTQDKNGDLKFNEGVSLGKAIKDGFGSATIENFSEMFGEYLPGAPKLLSKLGLSKVSSFFEKIGNNAYYKWLSNATNKSGIQGVMAEISEEEFGTALHAAWGDGDGSWSDFNVFTNPDAREKQIDTCLGMFYSVGFMHAPRTAIGAINAVLYFNIKHQVAKADKFGQMMFNDKWEDIKSKIDVTTNADLTKTVLEATRSDSMTAKQKGAVINYAMFLSKLRGFNQASDAKTKDKVEEGDTAPTLSNDLDDAYTEGHNADDADKHNIQLEQNDKANELAAMLHITPEQLHDMADEDLETMTGQDDKLDKAIYDYQVSTAKYQGVMDGAQDEVDMAAHQAAMETDNMTDLSRGTVRKATIKATGGLEDYEVYIISGNIATHDDGSIDVGNSDDMIIYYDPTTGRKEHADAMMFADLIEELPAADVKAQAVADAKENAIKKIAGIVDGTIDVGSQFSVTDSDGTEHTYEVLADNGDGTAMITIDGNVPTELVNGENVQIPYSFADLQQLKDAEDLKRLKAAKTEREQMEKERAEQTQETEQTEEIQPSFDFNQILNDNGNVVLADVLGKDGNTKYPNSQLFLIRDSGAKAKVMELKSDGTLVPHAVNKKDVRTATTMTLDEYKQAFADSSMIEENSGAIEGDRGGIEVNDELPPVPDNVTINGDGTYSVDGAVQGGENTTAPAEQTEQTPAMTLEDGTIVPMLEDGNPDFSKLTADQTAELYDTQFGDDADSVISGWVSDAKKALDKANNMTVKGKNFVEQKAAKEAKEKAIADAQTAYDSAIAIRDAYNSRQLAKVEDTAEGRKNLIEKARRKFSRLKSAVKDDAEAVSQLYKDVVGSLLHRLYDGTGIDVTDTIPLTAEEYVASNLGAHSLNYEGTETSKGVKQETGLSREDFAKTQLLAADGKGTTIDDLVHSLWENRPSNLDSLDTQDIRNALIGVLTSGFKASEARNYIENLRIAQAENILEEQKKAADNAAFAEENKAESEQQTETAPESEEKMGEDNSDEINDEENEQTNENINAPEVPEDATEENPLGAQRDQTDLPFSARDNGTQQTTSERAADVEKNKVDDMKVVDNIVGEKTRKAFERLAKMMGASIQWQYSDKLGNGWIQETTDADGNVHRTIFITLDSSITEGAQFIFGHEMTHQIKSLNPAAYNELTQLVLDTYGSDAFDKAVDETMQRYSDAGFSERARDYYAEEVVADAVGEMIRDLNLAHTLAMMMSHPLLAAIHEVLQKIKLAFYGTEYSDVTKNIIRSIEQAYVKTANGKVTNSETGEDVSFSLRQKPEPKKKGIGYKVFVLKDGKLYPPMVANPDGAATPVGVWLDADAAPIAGESKTGRPQVKQGGKGTQGGSGKLAYRPGWHLGVVPYAIQFNRKDAEGNKTLFPKNFVFAEVEYAADVDYQEEARQEGINPSGKYQHSLVGLKHLPTDGYYMYRTNPNPETDPWVITGAMKVNRILTRAEQAELVKNAGREPQQIQEGDIVTDDVVNSINQEIAAAPKFSLKVYHGSGADFTEFDFNHMGEGAGSQVFGWGGYVTSSKKIGKNYATLMDNDPSRAYFRIQRSNGTRFAKKYPTLESFLHGDKQIAMNDKFTEQEKIDFYNEMKKLAEPYHNLYEVDIPDDNGSNYMDWDKPLSKNQQDAIREGLEHLGVGIKTLESKGQSLERTGENVYNSTLYIGLTGTEYDLPERTKGISKFLSSVGFTGIKYKAGRNFGGAKKGDTNYVIFKPEDMRITEHTKFSLRLKSAIEETETNPSDAQKESGNYKKGHIKFGGYDYTIENPKGSTRSGKDADGKEWKVTMHDTYGYIRGKFGKDGDHLDMFINDKADLDNWNGDVFVVDQVNPDGSFDEHKVMYGYDSMDDAKKAYLANYSDGWQGLGDITGVSKDEFDKWLDMSKRKLKPFKDYAKVKFSLKDIKPVGVGAFGNIYNQFRGNAKAAIEFLKKVRGGEAVGALHHKDIGDIDLVWGKEGTGHSDGYGLSKLVKYHPEVLDNLQEILNDMRVVSSSRNRVNLESETHKAGVRLTWDGERKSWLLTAFKKETSASDKRTDTAATSLEGDTALSQTEGSAAKIDNSSETAKENGEKVGSEGIKFSLKDEKIKSIAEKFGVNEDDVAMYANAVERGSTAEAARARANIKRYLLQANEDKISSFKDIIKYTKPINEALKENFGDLDAMIEERRKQVEAERNAMEAARKRAQEEEEKRQKHLDELSLIPTDELDKRYMDAIANNDESTAREMLDESARRNGYGDVDSDYQGQGAWAAPSNPQYESDEARRADIENSPDVNLEDIALGYNLQPDDYFDNPRAYMNNTAYGLESAHVIKNALDAIKNGEKDVKVKVYRAVPTSVKEGKLRNGDWVTPSKKYAEMHGDNRLDGKYRIIEDEVPANQLWWDGNDVNEFGFDDGKEYRYKNAKNNRKLNDLITYDNKGNVIPPSKRFNSRKSDIRFSLKEEKEKIVADAKANGTYMTAPNGEKTKLDAEQWATVRTTNFKNWFGDWENDPENASKVVDENGEPMVVWHGRSAEFNTFEKKEGVRFIMGLEDKVKAEGFFFSPDKGLAEEFASNSSRHRGGKANVVPCFLNIRKPMDLTGEDYDRIYEDVTGWEYMVGMDTQDNLWGIMDEEGMADKIKKKGYDGAIFVEEVDDSYEPTKISYCALDANQIKSAENNNGDFSADNNDIRFSLAGERGAAAADKADERTFRMDNLSVARKMEEEKKDAKAIKIATGWERGADGKWRYEMPDAKIKDTMDVGGGHIVKRYEDDMLWNGGKLSDVIDAPELFKAYPHLKDVRIETDAIMNDMPSNGEYNAKTNTITIHADELKYMNSILNHEIQHAIQSIEGFDRGGSPRLVRGEIKKRLAEVTKQIRQLRAEGKEDEAKAIVEKNRGLYNAYQANDDYNSYKSLAGEVEARNVQERMNMTPEERRKSLVESTEDVARKDQIFLGVGDVSFSLRDMADGKESGAADMAEDLKSLNTPDEVDDAIKTAIDDMPSGWRMANRKMIHIAQALGENRKAEIAGEEPKFSLKDGTLIKAGTYFSGGGLVEEGLKGIIDPVLAVEYDEKISGVYRNNFGQHIVTADVRDVDPKELVKLIDGEVEYFHASPVCKNYSQAKSNHAEVELDKETAASTAEFINSIKPKVVTIENVKGYKDSDAMKIITDALDANGYTWDADVYNAADYGGYTNRERLIVRAVRDGKLPAKPKKMAHKSGWYEAVADIIPTLTEKKNGVAPWMDIRLKTDGIDWRNIDKPLYVMGSAYADGKIPHAFADELLPTLRTKSGDVIVMPDGKIYRAMGRVLARVSGVSDDYKMPFSENLSHTIIGNGIPTQLTEHVIAPLLQNTLRPTTPEDGNTKFSLRYDKFEHDLNQWKKDNNLPKDAQRPTIPQRNAGESAVDFLRRVDEYRKQMALWKTAPTYEQHLLSDDTALGEFNRELQRGSVLKRIAFQDSMLAIRKAQEAIMKEVGVDRLNMAEDAYTAENRSHGKGKNEFEEYNNEFLQPLRKAYHQMKKVLGDSYDNVRVYMMAKHGLERDAQMAFKKSLEADYEDVNQRSAAYKAYKNDLDRVSNDADLEFGRVDFTTWRQKDNALRGKYSPSYMDYRYDENGIVNDYSGLSQLFGGSDFEEAAHKLVRDVETKHLAEVQTLWNATNAATKKILRDGFKAGMMSKDAYEYVKGMYSHYIPLRGWDGTTADQVWDYIGGGKGAFNQTLKTAHGRTSIADDPIAYIENMAESGILLNNKNWVKQHLMLLAQNHPTSLLTLSKAWYVKSTDANGNEEWIPATPKITSQMNSNQVKAAIDAFEQKMEQMAQTGDATQQRDGLNIAYPQTHSEEREHEVRVMKDGEEYVIYVNGDPQLAQAMNNTRAHRVREIQSGKLDRAAAWLGRKMAAAYTSLSPLFIPSNYFRDLTMTLASTAIREDGRYNYLLRRNLATSWNLGFMLRDYQNGKLREKVSNGNATPKEQMFYDFMMNGGETGFVSSLDVEDLKKKFKNDLKDLDRWKANPVKVGHTIMDGIEFLNRMIEDSNRFAVYMTSIQYGRSIDEAVNDAKDVTLNFNRKGTGEYGWQMIRNLYLFINPAVQSLQTLGALAKHHPFKFTAVTAAWLASGVLVPIVNAALMSLLGGDDDKDKYWQFTKWDRRNNLIMWVPFTHEYVTIPLAQEFRAFYGVGDMIASKMMGGELAEETWSQYAEDLLGQVVDMLPLDPTGYDGNIAVSLMPNPIRPVFELAFNVDFTGKPLFKDTEYNKYDPNFTKAYVGTPDWLVRASRMMNSIGNDYPDVQQNRWDALGNPRYNINNPAVVDHVLSSYLGGAYTMGSQVLGVLTKSLNDPKEIKMADIPLVSKFVSNPDDRPVTKKQGDEFWNMKENHDRAANTLSKLKKQAKVDGDYSMLERFYGSEEYKQYKQEDVKVKKYEEDKKKERAEESGEEYRPHKLNAEDIYKAHATPKDDFEDLKLKQLYTKLNGFKTSYDLLLDTAPSQSDGYYNTNKAAIDAIDEISLDKQEISELKKGFLEDGKDAYNAEDMKRIRELRKRILSVLEPANKVVVANQKAKAEK
ncbi:hypothetical protein DW657_06970 [Prevotella sp. AM23-5]|uniref:DNA cytosine methyltransferase n=1 Tax=Prevotellaceae TaxID=171552 RepID=UPI000E535560|nr:MULTISPECIES: DNA cytosine methyltransferase [Prevotellaceae]RHN96453.1 hypothetical protein DW657_06970 [Prevotella sp. AM23-5]